MAKNPPSGGRFVFLLLGLCAVALFFELGHMDVWSDNEAQRTTPPAEMLRTHSFLIPTLNGQDYLKKPPLVYWMIAGVYAATGTISPWTARIPTALCGAGLVVSLYLLTRRAAKESAARWGALALLASPYFLDRARLAELDVPLVFAIALMILFLREAAQTKRRGGRRFAVYAGLALGAAILLKGPVPLLFMWAAWVGHRIESAAKGSPATRALIRVCLVTFAIEAVLKTTALLFSDMARIFNMPVALILILVWGSWVAWRAPKTPVGPSVRLWMIALLVGVAVALPWGLAVLVVKGWPYIDTLLRTEVVDRTHTATKINWGSPFFYITALPLMLAPWGFLLPLQVSAAQWKKRPSIYRFGVATGWVSVLAFSFIAGKEYEYVLPAVPFLALAVGFPLADIAAEIGAGWIARWQRIWSQAIPALLGIAGVGMACYAWTKHMPNQVLAEIAALAALGVLAMGWALLSGGSRRMAGILVIAIAALLSWLLVKAEQDTRNHSPKAIATLAGDLVRAGYTVQASQVVPPFAFYAGAVIPEEQNAARVRDALASSQPYYYVTRDAYLPMLNEQVNHPPAVLAGPYTRKGMLLIGNAPLPEGFTAPPPTPARF